jgi:hypothetical protein
MTRYPSAGNEEKDRPVKMKPKPKKKPKKTKGMSY